MEHITEQTVTDYIRATVRAESGRMAEMERFAAEQYIPIIQKEAGRFLRVLVGMLHPARILEIGTAIGYSAILMAESCDAEIITIERDEEMYCMALENIAQCGKKGQIRALFGEAENEIRNLPGKFDFIFIDAAKGQTPIHFDLALEKLAEGGVILTDNVLYRGKVAETEDTGRKHRTIVTKLKEFLETLCTDERFDTAILPIGDGMALTRVLSVNKAKGEDKCM